MKLKILLEAPSGLLIPWDYRTTLTKFIYETLRASDEQYSIWLHDIGYQRGKKKYRLFVYSNFRPISFHPTAKGMQTNGVFTWEIASPSNEFLEKLLEGLKKQDLKLSLFNSEVEVVDTVRMDLPLACAGRTWKTISPMVVSTWDGKSAQPTYRSPSESEFASALESNIVAKWEAFHQRKWEGEPLGVRVWNPKSTLVPVFGIKIRAWYVDLQLWGSEELIRFAYDAGLGEKNSQGFGMIEIGG